MHFFTSLTTLLLTAFLVDASPLASTAPTKARGLGSGNSNSNYNYNYKKAFSSSHGGGPHHACLNKTGIAALVDGYTYLLEHPGGSAFNTTANTILSATNFTVQSDSILTLSGRPVRTIPTFPQGNPYPRPPKVSFSPLQHFPDAGFFLDTKSSDHMHYLS